MGRSQGSYDQGQGELADAATVLDWVQGYNSAARFCWVAGHSFGAWIGMQLLRVQKGIEITTEVVPDANHLFSDHLSVLEGHIQSYLDMRLPLVEKERSERTITGKR